MRKQKGQAMAEYVIVCAGLITALFLGANVECDGSDNKSNKCISKLLTVLHDNYDGYSSSISGVQQYGEYAAKGSYDGSPDDGTGSGSGNTGTGGTVGSGLNPDGLTDQTQITSADGLATYGTLQPDGTVVNANGDITGFYSDTDNTFTDNNGNTYSAANRALVLDEEGNILHLRAVTDCLTIIPGSPKPVYSWGYVSIASGKVFNSLDKKEMDISGYCTEPSFKVVKNGQQQGGRILNSEYFAATFAANVSANPLNATGDVVYWEELGICSVMVKQWDADVDSSDSDSDQYAARFALFTDQDRNLGQIDINDYFTQLGTDPSKKQLNDCPTTIIISRP
tara:strand:+ start:72117 stop:73133 length:1017 start_codon:yes stop_codon:yes gene_type:complete